jgi:hypothetical protein
LILDLSRSGPRAGSCINERRYVRHDERNSDLGSMIHLASVIVMRTSMPQVRIGLAVVARVLLLLLGPFPSVLGRLMMTDDAPGAGAENAVMAGVVPCNSAHRGTL